MLQPKLSDAAMRRQRVQDLLARREVWFVIAALAGLLMAELITGFNLRLMKFGVGLVAVVVVVRFPLAVGIGMLLAFCSFPTAVMLGNTNDLLSFLLIVVWIAKRRLRMEPPWRRSYVDWAIAIYLAVHVVSLINVESQQDLAQSVVALRHIATPVLLFYLVVSIGRSDRLMLFFTEMFCLGMMLVFLSALMQFYFPGAAFLPRGYLSGLGASDVFDPHGGIRVGGVLSHAVLSDFAAIIVILNLFLILYYRDRRWLRLYHWLMLAGAIYMISLSGNRGGLIVLFGGLFYFLWVFSGEVTPRRVLIGLILLVAGLLTAETVLFQFKGEGSLLGRLAATHFDRGIPDTRRFAWSYILDRIQEKPWLGHGPFFDPSAFEGGEVTAWPHNAYLYYMYTIGIVGIPTFLILSFRLLKGSWAGRRLKVSEISFARGLSATMHIAILQFLVGQLRTDHQRGSTFSYLMWIVFALAMMARENYRGRQVKDVSAQNIPVRSSADGPG